MKRFVRHKGNVMTVPHGPRLTDHVHKDTLQQELENAIVWCMATITQGDWMTPLGQAAAVATPKAVKSKLKGTGSPLPPDAVLFGGALGMLDLRDRVKPLDELDVGRMRWACEVLDAEGKFSKEELRQVRMSPRASATCSTSATWHDPRREERAPLAVTD